MHSCTHWLTLTLSRRAEILANDELTDSEALPEWAAQLEKRQESLEQQLQQLVQTTDAVFSIVSSLNTQLPVAGRGALSIGSQNQRLSVPAVGSVRAL